jgi:hypothetical protein
MAELMTAAQLWQMAGVGDQFGTRLRRVVPVLRWTIDASTGRAVNHWVVAEKPASTDLSILGQHCRL